MADVEVFDTTLRDGTQARGRLALGRGQAAHRRAARSARRRLHRGRLARLEPEGRGVLRARARAHLAARRDRRVRRHAAARTSRAEDDASLRALVEAGTRVVCIFGKSWTLHVERVLRTTRDENLAMIEETVAFLRAQGKRVIYDAEHFFDGWRADAEYALETLRAAARGGAETIVLCDTNGGSLPWQIADGVARRARGRRRRRAPRHPRARRRRLRRGQLARRGARRRAPRAGHDQRLGRALRQRQPVRGHPRPRAQARPALPARRARSCELTELSRFVCDVANLREDDHMPYVGRSAFAHKGGVHVAAMRLAPRILRARRAGARRQQHARGRQRARRARDDSWPRRTSTGCRSPSTTRPSSSGTSRIASAPASPSSRPRRRSS